MLPFDMVTGIRISDSRHFNGKALLSRHLSGKECNDLLHYACIPHLYAYFFHFLPLIIAVYFNHHKRYMPLISGGRRGYDSKHTKTGTPFSSDGKGKLDEPEWHLGF